MDIGATKTVVALYEDELMTEVERFLTAKTPAEEVVLIVQAVQKHDLAAKATAVGMGAPGPLDPRAGVILAPPNLPGWRNFPLVDRVSAELGLPAQLENDATAGALGEALHGSGAGYDSMFYLTISTGIGAGMIIDGRIFGGHRGIAGEVFAVEPGHFTGEAGGDNVNELASGPGLVRCAKRRIASGQASSLAALNEDWDTRELFAAVDAGDPVATETLEAGRNAIAGLLTTVLFTFAPDSIVLAGGLCTDNTWFVDPVREKVRHWMTIPELAEVPIERATLWDKAVLYGAAELVRQADLTK